MSRNSKLSLQLLTLILMLIGAVLTWTNPLFASDKVHYQATYKGVFSLYQSMKIADVFYSVSDHPMDKDLSMQQIRLWVTSERFGTVEKLYPFRYLYKSFFQPVSQQTLGFENLKQTKKKKKLKHQVGLLDFNQKRVQLYSSPAGKELLSPGNIIGIIGQQDLAISARKLALTEKARPLENLPVLPIDRLTMLEAIRQQLIKGTEEQHYRVTNGDELFDYRVTLLKNQAIKLSAVDYDTRKIKIEAFRVAHDESQPQSQAFSEDLSHLQVKDKGYAHAPVYVWFTTAAPYRAVKFLNKHAVGNFIIEMVEAESPVSEKLTQLDSTQLDSIQLK